MSHAKWFGVCLIVLGSMGTLEPQSASAQYPSAPSPAALVGQVPAVAGQPMYYPAIPMVGAAYVPGYVYLPRRAYRAPNRFLRPSAVFQVDVGGTPGIAPSWSTWRAGLDQYPLLGGVDVVPAPGLPNGYVPPPSNYAPSLQPTPDPMSAQPSLEAQPPAPMLRPPVLNTPTAEPVSPELVPTPPATSAPTDS